MPICCALPPVLVDPRVQLMLRLWRKGQYRGQGTAGGMPLDLQLGLAQYGCLQRPAALTSCNA